MKKFLKKNLAKILSLLSAVLLPVRVFLAKRNIFIFKNDRELWSIVGSSKGRDAVIIGMGPSFQKEDVERFKGYLTFACNKIFLMEDESSWRPDFYSVSDFLVAENNAEAILNYKGTAKFLHPAVVKCCPDLKGMSKLRVDAQRNFKQAPAPFNHNPISGLIQGGGTVLASLIQMAYWAGCKNIYVVGLDFSFSGGVKTEEKTDTGDQVILSEGEVNHFHPNYRQSGETWTTPKYEIMQEGFLYARKALEAKGVRLINASRRTKLDVLEHIPFDEAFPPFEQEELG